MTSFKSGKIELPKDKFIIIIRDKKMYYTWGIATDTYEMFDSMRAKYLTKAFIQDTDVIYACPTHETYYDYISRGKCLDEFKLKPVTNDTDADTVIKFLKENPNSFVGREQNDGTRHRIMINDGLKCVDKTGKTAGSCYIFNEGMKYLHTDCPYEFFRWLNRVS